MLYLLHGEDISASREALLELKKNYSSDSVSVFDAKKFDEDEFTSVYETPSMFAGHRLVIIEGKLPTSTVKQFDNLTICPSSDLVFWIPDQLKSSHKLFKQIKEFGGQIRHFKPAIPKHVFGFLDALGYKNKQKSFLELHRLLDQGESPVYLLTMMVWEARNLLKVQLSLTGGPKPKMAPFALSKAKVKVRNFEEGELVEIFHKLLEAEIALKTTKIDSVLTLDRLVDSIISNV